MDTILGRVNLVQIREDYLRGIQRLKDALYACYAGLNGLTPEEYESHHHFVEIDPLTPAKLTHGSVVPVAKAWLTNKFVLELIDGTNSFLERCYTACLLIGYHGRHFDKAEAQVVDGLTQKFHRDGLPRKLAILNDKFSVSSSWNGHIISLNDARACLVHRLGRVSEADTNGKGALVVRLWTSRIVAVHPDGREEIISGPRRVVAEWKTQLRSETIEKAFPLGGTIEFDLDDIFGCVLTWFVWSDSLVQSIGEHAKSKGAEINVLPQQQLKFGVELEGPEGT